MGNTHTYILGLGALGSLWASQLTVWQHSVALLLKDAQHKQGLGALGITLEHQQQRRQHSLPGYSPASVLNPAALNPATWLPASSHRPSQSVNDLNLVHAKREYKAYGCVEQPFIIKHLLVTTKTYATIVALRAWQGCFAEDISILLLQNGMGLANEVQKNWPKAKIYCAVTTDGAWRKSPYHTVWSGRGETYIGAYSASVEADNAPAFIQAWIDKSLAYLHTHQHLRLTWHPHIITPMWHKLAINSVINPLTCLYKVSNGDLARLKAAKPMMIKLCQETEEVMSHNNIAPMTIGLLDRVMEVLQLTAGNQSSMWQDQQAGRPLELDAINGYIIRQGKQVGLACAAHRQLVQQLSH